MNQTKPRCLRSRAQSKQTRNLFVSSETIRATAAVRSCGASSPSCACLLPWFPVSTGSWTPHCKASGGRWWLRSHSRQKNAREIPIPPVFFLAFSPRLCPQRPNPTRDASVAVLLAPLSPAIRIDFAPTPLPVPHTKDGKKPCFFLRRKERERKLYYSLLSSPAADTKAQRQAGGQGRQEASSAKARRGETASRCIALHWAGGLAAGGGSDLASLAVAAACLLRLVALRPLAGGLGPARRDLARAADSTRVGRPGS